MIFGIGVDLVETQRIERLLQEYGERFARDRKSTRLNSSH